MPVHLQTYPSRFANLAVPLRRLLNLLHITAGSWSISVIRDSEMAALHSRTMNIRTTTDVLTFDLRDSPQKTKIESQMFLDLDTVICLDEARRRATEFRHPIAHELLLYAVHSLLHVQGYDDATPAQSQRMHAREDQLLAAIGIGPVFARAKTRDSRRKVPPRNRKSKNENRKTSRRVS